ncbi:hypothetical protein HanRHA438_Chr09g0383251 [Helianthus annuus]|nr:hypothetical protein HanRHA438_Chr09g0383251 [Helianthus annuus]
MSQAPQMRLHDDYSSDIDLSWGSARQAKSTSVNSDNSRVPSFQRPTASSHRRLTRSISQAPQMRRSHEDYLVRQVPTSTYLQPEHYEMETWQYLIWEPNSIFMVLT